MELTKAQLTKEARNLEERITTLRREMLRLQLELVQVQGNLAKAQ